LRRTTFPLVGRSRGAPARPGDRSAARYQNGKNKIKSAPPPEADRSRFTVLAGLGRILPVAAASPQIRAIEKIPAPLDPGCLHLIK
jgi:hypothetical protein